MTKNYCQSIRLLHTGEPAEVRTGFGPLSGTECLGGPPRQTGQPCPAETDKVFGWAQHER